MRLNASKLLLCLTLLGAVATAQVDQGQIAGTVTDSSGALVPNATLTVVNSQTGASQPAKSGTNGAYIVTNVPLGDYTVTVEASGFKKFTKTGIRVNAATRTTVDVELEVGLQTQSVTSGGDGRADAAGNGSDWPRHRVSPDHRPGA